jgi:hypothetical protein
MRFEIPQYIDVEDKIFGPLSWKQFLYLGGGIGASIAIFLVAPLIIFVLLGIPIALLSLALAFYPINNRPFSYFLEAVFNYTKGNDLYLWRQNTEAVYQERIQRQSDDRDIPISTDQRGKESAQNVNSLARRLELQAMQKEK